MLSELFLVTVISFPLLFLMLSSNRCIDATTWSSMLASHLPPSFFDTSSLSITSLRCKALGIVISFLLWSICWSSSLVHFKKVSDFLTRGTAQVFTLLIKFLLLSIVLRYSFFIFAFISALFWWFPLSLLPNICKFSFLRAFWFFLHLALLFLPLFVFFCFSQRRHIFYAKFHSYRTWLYFLVFCIRVSNLIKKNCWTV